MLPRDARVQKDCLSRRLEEKMAGMAGVAVPVVTPVVTPVVAPVVMGTVVEIGSLASVQLRQRFGSEPKNKKGKSRLTASNQK